MSVTPGTQIKYKYLRFKIDGTTCWEDRSDRVVDVPKAGISTQHDVWDQQHLKLLTCFYLFVYFSFSTGKTSKSVNNRKAGKVEDFHETTL